MPNVSKHERFPRLAMWRRVDKIMDVLVDWGAHYQELATEHDSPGVRARAWERAVWCDSVWHQLAAARDELGGAR